MWITASVINLLQQSNRYLPRNRRQKSGCRVACKLMAAGISLCLMLSTSNAQATFQVTGDSDLTYVYTAANIDSVAELTFHSSWRFFNSGMVGTNEQYVPWACYRAAPLYPTLNTKVDSVPYQMNYQLDITNTNSRVKYQNVQNGTWYNTGQPASSGAPPGPVNTEVTVRVPAGQTMGKAPGNYSIGYLNFNIDMQENRGTQCEALTNSWDSGNTTYIVTFTIPKICRLVTTNRVDFGVLHPGRLEANRDAVGSIIVNCNGNFDYSVVVGNGQAFSNGERYMQNATSRLLYQLFKDPTRLLRWDGSRSEQYVGNLNNQELFVYGRIPAGTVVPSQAGTYSDNIVVTVTY